MMLSRRLGVAVVGLALLFGTFATSPTAARAQDDADAAAAAATGDNTPRVTADESFLHWMIRASGGIGLLILVMSLYLAAVVAWMALNYRPSMAMPESLIRDVTELVDQKKFTEGYGRLAADGSFLARVLAAGVRKLPAGVPAAQRAMELANEDVTMEMEHRTTYLATVGTLGPMIGLVGTVYGMIMSFRVIATAGSSPQASQLAAGISTALFATLEGIALSVPAIALYAYFRNRIARLSLEVAMAAEGMLEGFSQGVRMPHPLVAAGAASGPPALAPRTALPPTNPPLKPE